MDEIWKAIALNRLPEVKATLALREFRSPAHLFCRKSQQRTCPFGDPCDSRIGLRCAPCCHLEGVQHLGEDVELRIHSGALCSVGEGDAIVKKAFIASDLEIDRRKTAEIASQRADMGIRAISIRPSSI